MTREEERMFHERMERHMEELRWLYMELYGNSSMFAELCEKLYDFAAARPAALKKRDLERERDSEWYKSNALTGMMLYIDNFAGNLEGLQKKLPYIQQAGVNLLHLMPFLDTVPDRSDGGYAVADFRKVRPDLGTMEDLEKLAAVCHEKGINLCMDFVMNHTSEDHEWAKKARQGDGEYMSRYFFFADPAIPAEYEKTVPQVFPSTAPGNFTWLEDCGHYVMTTFYPYQWDLNYQNPRVFNEMMYHYLFLANKGMDMIRIDAVPYIWKELGTDCRNRPKVHTIVRMMRMIGEIVCPSVVLLGEVVMEPVKVVPYFGTVDKPECHLLYNVTTMCTTWHTAATRDTRLLRRQLDAVNALPKEYVFLNYLRCHDDIGWGLDYEWLNQNFGTDEVLHKRYLNDYFQGFAGNSASRGELYNDDIASGDARLCGTTASLCGIEKAGFEQDREAMERAVRFDLTLHAMMYNPFVILCEKGADETMGSCYGFSFVYSGEFLIEAEKDQLDRTRFICGIHPDNFSWVLHEGESLWLPEVIMTHSGSGMGKISRNLHKVIREHICRGKWKNRRRPVLVNNWEATYFKFTGEKLIHIAREAKQLGIELFAMDDGWFGNREDDSSGLGDWFPNEKKLGCTLKELAERITAEGMQFGIWLEPEGISEDSDLYRSHPDWVVGIPGRKPCLSRCQWILDFSRKDVQDYIIGRISELFDGVPVSYVKWDCNRAICDKFSGMLDSSRQGEFSHRYVLGLYRVLEELTERFPEILFEGCGGGGGRFDTGMLYYMPQLWGSDTTDAIERLSIQYGASFGYPVCAMGTHVATAPNHQTGRVTPLSTRGCVAMAGTFGYELDISSLTEEEKAEVKEQISWFKRYYDLIQYGDYYRISSPLEGTCTVWEMADPSGKEALVSAVYHHVQANPVPVRVKVQGLKDDTGYQMFLNKDFLEKYPGRRLPYGFGAGEVISGAALRQFGFVVPEAVDGFQAWQIYIKECPDSDVAD